MCYQLPAALSKGVTLVISPLKALIDDRLRRAHNFNLDAMRTGGASYYAANNNAVIQRLKENPPALKMIFTTLEVLTSSNELKLALTDLYTRELFDRIVIDEAHCITEWGDGLWPSHSELGTFCNFFSGVPVTFLTATATISVRNDIKQLMNLNENCEWFIDTIHRPNLIYQVLARNKKIEIAKQVVEKISSSFANDHGIIYCSTKHECEQIAQFLNEQNIRAEYFHPQVSDEQRIKVTQMWFNDECKVICATLPLNSIKRDGTRGQRWQSSKLHSLLRYQ